MYFFSIIPETNCCHCACANEGFLIVMNVAFLASRFPLFVCIVMQRTQLDTIELHNEVDYPPITVEMSHLLCF